MGTRAWLSVRRRRRSPRDDLGALAIVIAILAISAMSVYLLALAAAGFVAWLLRVATRHRPEILAEVSERGPVDARYRPVLDVDPAVFKDGAAIAAAARRAFEAWVRGLPRAPRHSIDLVRSVDRRTRQVARLTTELETRRVVERCAPAPVHEPPSSPRYLRQHIDPWNPPDDLPRSSRFITACWTCNAKGRVECPACHGSARRTCGDCKGSGKYYGQTASGARRLLNCKGCRGKGHVVCADCTRGKIECATCQQAKKLACWLEVTSELRHDVQLGPDAPSLRPFSWSQPGVRATADQLSRDAQVIDAVARHRVLAPEDLISTLPAEWRGERALPLQAAIGPDERVRSQTLTLLAVPSVSIAYALHGEQHTVVLEGLRMLAPPAGDVAAEPFLRRARMLGRAALALAALPVAAVVIYVSRGEYFATGRGAGLAGGVMLAAVAAAAFAHAVLRNASLGRRRARTWALATIVPVALATVFAAAAEPRLDRARELVTAGQLDTAAAELHALGLPTGDDAWAELHLRRSLLATTCADATAALRDIRAALPERAQAQAQAHADDLAVEEAQSALRAADADHASTALTCSSEGRRTTPAARALRAQIADLQTRRCIDTKDWRCALERAASSSDPAGRRADTLAAIRTDAESLAASAIRAPSLEQRIAQEQAALALWQTYLVEPPPSQRPGQPPAALPGPVTALRTALARDQAALATQQRISRARAEAEARRQAAAAERERKRAERAAEQERRRQAAEEARANRSSGRLLCNDGTVSPTCTCAGSHRGCCSWHGGVAGCE